MKIIGFSGRKQGGKNTAANYLNGFFLKQSGSVRDFNVLDNGDLNVFTEFGDGSYDWGILDIYRKDDTFIEVAEQTMWPFVKNYSFADCLKEVAVDLFELNPENVYGTDEQKNEPIHLKWENMPGVITDKDFVEDLEGMGVNLEERFEIIYHEPGNMTGREFLQFLGTEIGRKMHGPIWVNATINKIFKEQSGFAIVTDVRFPDEVQAIQEAGGYVFRLTRKITDEDLHPSEVSLEQDVFDWNKFDGIIDNQELSINETSQLVLQQLQRLQLI